MRQLKIGDVIRTDTHKEVNRGVFLVASKEFRTKWITEGRMWCHLIHGNYENYTSFAKKIKLVKEFPEGNFGIDRGNIYKILNKKERKPYENKIRIVKTIIAQQEVERNI